MTMSEKKKGLGKVVDKQTGRKFGMVSVFAGRYAGGNGVLVSKTEIGTYVIGVKRTDENGDELENQMYLTRESFSALTSAIYMFLSHEKEDMDAFVTLAIDDESGIMYKKLDVLKEDGNEGTEGLYGRGTSGGTQEKGAGAKEEYTKKD